MKLSTELSLEHSPYPIDYNSRLLCLGSCFAEHLSRKLSYYKFQVVNNPFGILFHPKSILDVVEKAVTDKEFTTDDVFEHDAMWHSFFSHSRLSRRSSSETLSVLHSAKEELKEASAKASHIIITLGTSFLYHQTSSGQSVANCHKLPQHVFDKSLSSVGELESILSQLIANFETLNPGVNLIFTISPVRHIKDGIIENQRSKANLISALHSVIEDTSSTCLYFPSYELMMDEYRDYRFYDRDLIHPNALAVDLIWDKFKTHFIANQIFEAMQKVEKLQKSLAHRPSQNDGEIDQKLALFQSKIREELKRDYPFMNF
jgi:hypothetical protein